MRYLESVVFYVLIKCLFTLGVTPQDISIELSPNLESALALCYS